MTGSDAELLRRSASGEHAAFEAFVDRHQASLFRFLGSLTSNVADAEDALQETFVAAWRGASGFRGESARPWLWTIARNALRRAHRRRAGEPERFVSLDELGRDAGWGAESRLDAELERVADRELLQDALGSLSTEDREMLLLRDVEGFSGDEVAEMIGITVPAMKSRLHRARLRLTAALREGLDVGA